MKKCPKCGALYEDDKKFCKKCGTALQPVYNLSPEKIAEKSVFEEKLKANSLNLELLNEYLLFLYDNKIYDEAISVSYRVLALDKKNKKAEVILFKSCFAKGNIEEAVKAGERLLLSNPDDTELLEKMGDLFENLKEYDKAIEYYQKILDQHPNNNQVLYKKAVCLVKQNSLVKAAEIFRRLKEEGNKEFLTSVYSSLALVLDNQFDDALKTLMPVLSSGENFQNNKLAYVRGRLYVFYALVMTKSELKKIEEQINKIDFQLLKDNYCETDEQLLSKAILEYAKLMFANCKSSQNKIIIDNFIRNIIKPNEAYFTDKTKDTIADLWLLTGSKQNEIGLYAEARQSLINAKKVNPDNELIEEQINVADENIKKKKQKEKRKNIVISAMVIVGIIAVVLAVWMYQKYKEDKSWKNAKTEFTYNSFQNYLNEYPGGKYTKEADNLKEEALWKEAKNKNTIESYENYLTITEKNEYIDSANMLRKNILLSNITVKRIKNDLLGEFIPGWNFAYLSEFIKVIIVNSYFENNFVFLRLNMKLEDYITKNKYYAKAIAKYSISESKRLVFEDIIGYYYSNKPDDFIIDDKFFIIGKWRWSGNIAEYKPDGTWSAKYDNGDNKYGRWSLLNGHLMLYIGNSYRNLWLDLKIVNYDTNKFTVKYGNNNTGYVERIVD